MAGSSGRWKFGFVFAICHLADKCHSSPSCDGVRMHHAMFVSLSMLFMHFVIVTCWLCFVGGLCGRFILLSRFGCLHRRHKGVMYDILYYVCGGNVFHWDAPVQNKVRIKPFCIDEAAQSTERVGLGNRSLPTWASNGCAK